MKFLVDAQLPRRMALWLRERGHDALHTLDLPDANRTTDAEIVELAIRDSRVVVTKERVTSRTLSLKDFCCLIWKPSHQPSKPQISSKLRVSA
jgi:predicted nuclease of predicted toxin-antitoxin system